MTYTWLAAAGFRPEHFTPGGVQRLAEILQRVDPSTQQRVLIYLDHEHPELAAKVRAALVTVDDVLAMEPRSMQVLLKAIAPRDLLLVLKALDPASRARLLAHHSANRRAMLEDDMEALGRVRKTEAEAAVATMVATARRLEQEGALVIRLPAGDAWIE